MDQEKLLNAMLTMDGGEHEFIVQRNVEAQDRDGLGAGMSPEAMQMLHQSMITWVGTRMIRFEQERGVMPQNVKVSISVEMEI